MPGDVEARWAALLQAGGMESLFDRAEPVLVPECAPARYPVNVGDKMVRRPALGLHARARASWWALVAAFLVGLEPFVAVLLLISTDACL
jgi:hypothetical protein